MTPKELLYIEDALDHQSRMKQSFTDWSNRLQDPDLKQFMESLADRQATEYNRFYKLFNA